MGNPVLEGYRGGKDPQDSSKNSCATNSFRVNVSTTAVPTFTKPIPCQLVEEAERW
jgi:hypothetical protein